MASFWYQLLFVNFVPFLFYGLLPWVLFVGSLLLVTELQDLAPLEHRKLQLDLDPRHLLTAVLSALLYFAKHLAKRGKLILSVIYAHRDSEDFLSLFGWICTLWTWLMLCFCIVRSALQSEILPCPPGQPDCGDTVVCLVGLLLAILLPFVLLVVHTVVTSISSEMMAAAVKIRQQEAADQISGSCSVAKHIAELETTRETVAQEASMEQ